MLSESGFVLFVGRAVVVGAREASSATCAIGFVTA